MVIPQPFIDFDLLFTHAVEDILICLKLLSQTDFSNRHHLTWASVGHAPFAFSYQVLRLV